MDQDDLEDLPDPGRLHQHQAGHLTPYQAAPMGLPLGPAPADVVKQRGWTASIARRSALQDAAGRPYVSLQARCGSIGHANAAS